MDITSLNLKKFEEYGAKISRKISVNRSFSFGFPPALCQEEGIFQYNHVIMFFDEAQKVVGMQFVSHSGESEGFKINSYGEGSKTGASVIARSFFNKYNIDPRKVYGKYEFEKMPAEGGSPLYLIQLKEHHKVSS